MADYVSVGESSGVAGRTKFLFKSMKVVTVLGLILCLPHVVISAENSCYDSSGRAQKCVPEFVNAAFNLSVEATNTCGVTEAQEFCVQTGVTGVRKSCGHLCDAASRRSHPPSFMTDFNNQNNWTWWQSETMLERRSDWLISRQQHVNLTLSLGKCIC